MANPILVDLDPEALHRLVPIEIDQLRIRILPDRLRDAERGLAGPLYGWAADAILQGPADRRAQLQRVDPGVEIGELGVERLLQARPDDFAFLDALGDDDRLGKIIVGELHVEGQIEADRTLADVEAVAIDVGVALQQRLEPFHLMLGGVDRRVLRQIEIDNQFRPVGGREELLLDEAIPVQRCREKSDRGGDHQPAGAHAEDEGGAEQPHETARSGMAAAMRLHRLRQDRDADHRRKHNRDDPRGQQRHGDHREQRIAIFAGTAFGKADRHKARDRDQGAGQHRKRRRRPGMRRRMLAIDALLKLADHHFDRDHRVVDEKAERDDQRTQRDPLQADAGIFHVDEDHSEHQRDRAGDHDAGAQAEAQEAYAEHDRDRFPQGLGKAADGFLDDHGLVGNEMRLDADRQMRDDLFHLVRHGLAEGEVVAALRHRNRQPDRRLAVEPEHRLRRIGVPLANCRHIGEAEEFAVGKKIDALQIVDRAEGSGNADRELLQTGLDDAGRGDGVLLLQGSRLPGRD